MPRVASIGECMIELRHRSATDLELGFGGDTLNTAVYLARIGRECGVHVDYVSALGDDAYSDQMLAMWQAEGVGTSLVARLPGRLPGLYTIRTDAQGERSFTYWRSAAAAREVMQDSRADRLAAALAGYELLYLSGITLSILDSPQRAALMALADALRAGGGRVAFDSNYRPVGWPDPATARGVFDELLTRTDIALPGLDDERALYGAADPAAAADRLHRLGVAEVVVKVGAEGSYLVLCRVHRRGAARPGRRGRRQHRRRRQLQRRLSRRAAARGRSGRRRRPRQPPCRAGGRPPRRNHPGGGDGRSAPAGALSRRAAR